MEYKFKTEEIEDTIKNEAEKGIKALLLEQENLKAKIISQKKLLDTRTNLLPLNTDILLKHWDILLETIKSFFLASSTIFVTSIAIDTSKILNINIHIIIKLSILGLIISIILGGYILYKRNQEKKEIIRKLSFLDDKYTELNKINHEILDMSTSKYLEEIKEAARKSIREDPIFKKHLPNDF